VKLSPYDDCTLVFRHELELEKLYLFVMK
jgi:hypothetical protein